MASNDVGPALLEAIRAENLGVYRESPIRVREDASQEAEIATNYRGRLVYELLQNADDAMYGDATHDDRIYFRLDESSLWVGNTGRPLTEADIRGLCGTGASSKGETSGPRRAFIGQKGMGFKSVLEITDRPRVYSTTAGFAMDAARAREPVEAQFRDRGLPAPKSVPVMRFPWPLEEEPSQWKSAREAGINTLFQFPLRPDLPSDQWEALADRLLTLPISTVLFLKHLEQVEVQVANSGGERRRRWRIQRERKGPVWEPVPGFVESGVYRVQVNENGNVAQFLVAHDADVAIGDHRIGLSGDTWEGIELTEVSVAAPWPPADSSLPPAYKFHVFLPTEEPSPYPLLVNGAFAADLSRQKIAASSDPADYNAFLARQAARVLVADLIPALKAEGAGSADLLRVLDRGGPTFIGSAGVAKALYEGVREELRDVALLPTEGGAKVPIDRTIVPPLLASNGGDFRRLLPADAGFDGYTFPAADLCGSELARVIVDHGGRELTPTEAAAVLSHADPDRSAFRRHPSGQPVQSDPVLSALGGIWVELRGNERTEFERSVREHRLFPIAVRDSTVVRVATTDAECFYPPRSFSGDPPLSRLRFLAQEVAWGGLTPKERNVVLRDDMPIWQGLFGLREFKFPDVMRASVLPALVIDPDEEVNRRRVELASIDRLAAICQLAGRTPKLDATLPYQRLGSDRALFNLARLPVPCRPDADGVVRWIPAFRVYFGRDWIGDASIEEVRDAAATALDEAAEVPMLAPPSYFLGQLGRYKDLADADLEEEPEPSSDEVSEDEDEEAALTTDEKDQWATFLTWLGVNHVMRPVSFHDVEDRTSGWLSTGDLKRPQGHAFRQLDSNWDAYLAQVKAHATTLDSSRALYFYELHDLEFRDRFAGAAAGDASGAVARAMWRHLARNWSRLERFTRLRLAAIPEGKSPGMRSVAKPTDDEIVDSIEDFWLWRLRRHSFAPTSQGPRRPEAAWLPSAEIDRRFGRRDWAAGNLIPVLDVPSELSRGRGLAFASALGVRDALSPSTFGLRDADLLLRRIASLFGSRAEAGELTPADLRQTIRPAYRNLFDLLTSQSESGEADGALTESPLLVTNGTDYRFVPASETVFADRNGARERIGVTGDLWMFVLEGYPTARAPLQRFMRSRLLEEALEWSAEPFDPMDDAEALDSFRHGLERLAPYILLRLKADRSEVRLANQDARRLRAFVASVQPVGSVRVGCRLDGVEVAKAAERDRYVRHHADGRVEAYVRWGSDAWPPDRVSAEALAAALTDLFETSLFESFFTLSSSESSESRLRTLRMAGAPTDLEEAESDLAPHDTESVGETAQVERVAPTADADARDERSGTLTPAQDVRDGRIPLYDPERLLIAGTPIMVGGDGESSPLADRGHSPQGTHRADGGGWTRGLTDLTELDRVGMAVAMSYEKERLAHKTQSPVSIFDPDDPSDEAVVFDVSNPKAVRRARDGSRRFRDVLAFLTDHGLSEDFPGFDILSIDPAAPNLPGRLIELKSSGVNASMQTMTWNEWKTGKDSRLRQYFYLYLVGNLRSDLGGARPFVRAIHDPVATLLSTESREVVRRAVQVNVRNFAVAEHLDLTVRPEAE